MNPAAEAQDLIRDIAGPMHAGAQIQEMLDAVARETAIGFRRVRAFWHGEARRIDSVEMDKLRAAAARRKRKSREAEDREDFRVLRARVAELEQRLASLTPQHAGAAPEEQGARAAGPGGPARTLAGA